jgi:2-hydroxychromene-2-carboxylate isomerase
MTDIEFFYDPISPYAHLAFAALPQALMGHSVVLHYRPVLFAGLLKAHGQLGPAEIPAKRDWTYRQIQWLAHTHGIRLDLPATHQFNPLPLGLASATAEAPGETSRYVTELLFQHVWHGGADAADPARLSELQARLQDHVAQRGRPWIEPDSDTVKQRLRANTDEALALGLFGVPALVVDGRIFWGFDALPMLKAWLDGDAWFDSGAWEAAARTAVGVQRR